MRPACIALILLVMFVTAHAQKGNGAGGDDGDDDADGGNGNSKGNGYAKGQGSGDTDDEDCYEGNQGKGKGQGKGCKSKGSGDGSNEGSGSGSSDSDDSDSGGSGGSKGKSGGSDDFPGNGKGCGNGCCGGCCSADSIYRQRPDPLPECEVPPIDLVFLLDMSISVNTHNANNWNTLLKFVTEIVRGLPVDADNVHICVVRYANENDVTTDVALTNDDKQDVIQRIQSLSFQPSEPYRTRTDLGLAAAKAELDSNGRGDVPSLVVLVTNGRSSETDLAVDQAEQLGDAGANLVLVGVGSISEEELEEFITDRGKIFISSGYKKLMRKLHDVHQFICDTPA